ncbi:hypothetical protein DFH27DRAFT_478098 [Peziza echinospora]|nr:hypothetical protein DFH27DRAFT_478098 [Peziza echinospora]
MAGLYAHPSFVASSAILSPTLGSSSSKDGSGSHQRGDVVASAYGSSSSTTLATTLSNSSSHTTTTSTNHNSGVNRGSTGDRFSKYSTDPHPGTLVTIESPIGSPTGNRKPSVFSNSKKILTPYRTQHGRRYHSDESILYLLPSDIPELSRQGIKHLLFKEVFGSYHMSDFSDPQKIPSKVLDIGCGTGLWISNMHDEFAARGRDDVKFFGMDIVPTHAPMPGVDFTYVKHNALSFPYPFKPGEFDYVFVRDLTLGMPDNVQHVEFIAECMRILKDGGLYEIQCTDHSVRSLLETKAPRNPGSSAYTITPITQFATQPKNIYIQGYNSRLAKVLTERQLSPIPCTLVGANLVMEDCLTNYHSLRLALPLDEIWWETESESSSPVDGLMAHYDIKRKSAMMGKNGQQPSVLTEEEKAVRYMARLQLSQFIESMDPYLRAADVSTDDYKPKDMMINFFREGGLRDGECVEFGAWWGTKRSSTSS